MAYNVDFSPYQMAAMQSQEQWKDLGYAMGAMGGMGIEAGTKGLLGYTSPAEFEGTQKAWGQKIIKDWFNKNADDPALAKFKDYESFSKVLDPYITEKEDGTMQIRSNKGEEGFKAWMADFLPGLEHSELTKLSQDFQDLFKKDAGDWTKEWKRYDAVSNPRTHRGLLGAPGSEHSGLLMPLFDREFWKAGVGGFKGGQYGNISADTLDTFDVAEEGWRSVNETDKMTPKEQLESFQDYLDNQNFGHKVKLGRDGEFKIDPGSLLDQVKGFSKGWMGVNDSAPGHEVPWWRKPAQGLIGSMALGGIPGTNYRGLIGKGSNLTGLGIAAAGGVTANQLKEGKWELNQPHLKNLGKAINKKLFPNYQGANLGQNIFGTPKINKHNTILDDEQDNLRNEMQTKNDQLNTDYQKLQVDYSASLKDLEAKKREELLALDRNDPQFDEKSNAISDKYTDLEDELQTNYYKNRRENRKEYDQLHTNFKNNMGTLESKKKDEIDTWAGDKRDDLERWYKRQMIRKNAETKFPKFERDVQVTNPDGTVETMKVPGLRSRRKQYDYNQYLKTVPTNETPMSFRDWKASQRDARRDERISRREGRRSQESIDAANEAWDARVQAKKDRKAEQLARIKTKSEKNKQYGVTNIDDEATRTALGLDGRTRTIYGSDGSKLEIPMGAKKKDYLQYLEFRKSGNFRPEYSWEEYKQGKKDYEASDKAFKKEYGVGGLTRDAIGKGLGQKDMPAFAKVATYK